MVSRLSPPAVGVEAKAQADTRQSPIWECQEEENVCVQEGVQEGRLKCSQTAGTAGAQELGQEEQYAWSQQGGAWEEMR